MGSDAESNTSDHIMGSEASRDTEKDDDMAIKDDSTPAVDEETTIVTVIGTSAMTVPKPKLTLEIRKAIENANSGGHKKPQGLLAFLKPCTRGEYDLQQLRETECMLEEKEEIEHSHMIATERKLREKQEGNRLRKQKERRQKKNFEIKAGIQESDGSKKRKVREVNINKEEYYS